MTLRKLSIILLLSAAHSFTFAQSADLTVTTSSKPNSAEKKVKSPAKSAAAKTTKKTVAETVKSPAKLATDTTKKATTEAVKSPAKMAKDSTKKVVVEAVKSPVKMPTDSAKKVVAETVKSPAKMVMDSTKKASTEAVKSVSKSSIPTTTDSKKTPSVAPQKSAVNPTSDNATVRNVTVLNGDKDDFSPNFFENGLLYCSNSRKASKSTDKSKVVDDLNLKFAVIDSLGNLSKPAAFSRRTNSKTHEGPSCFSLNGDTMFLTRVMSKGGVAKENKEGETTLKIYIKIRDKEGNFVGEEVMPFESETYSYCHPTLSADGQRLYFSSNMPGGFGGMDLWMSRKLKAGGWSQAMNLGSRVNTAGNELFPHFTMNNGLFFSSNGRKGNKGGLDIYRVDIDNKTARPFPLSDAFNSEGDDFGIMFLPNSERKGYFSSNRKGGAGGDDIYEFEIK